MKSSPKGTPMKTSDHETFSGTGSGSTSAHPQSAATTIRAGTIGSHIRPHVILSRARALPDWRCTAGHQPQARSVVPPRSVISMPRQHSRSIFQPPPGGYDFCELVDQIWVERLHRIDQRCHRGARTGAEQPSQKCASARRINHGASDACAIHKTHALALPAHKALDVEPVQHLGRCRINEPLGLTHLHVNVPHGSAAELLE